jgi:hypothetical protein
VLKYYDKQNAQQEYLVVRDGKGSLIQYMNTIDQFDSPESQEILNKMISSVKFT